MPGKYYYLVASLPYLVFGKKPPITRDAFINECEKWLAQDDMEALLSASIQYSWIKENDTKVLKDWKTFDNELKEELALVRKAKKENEAYKTPEYLKIIMDQETPLLMEQAMEKIRWNFIEDRIVKHFFDINFLIYYFLKLKILERLSMFDKDEGEKLFYNLCEVEYEQTIR